jgi:hypothetical protein
MRNKNDEIEKFVRLNEELSKFLYRHDFFTPLFSRKKWKKKKYLKTKLGYL